jgi:hypothetical protein
MTENLPRRYETGALSGRPSRFTKSGQLERRTQQVAERKSAQHYLNLLEQAHDTAEQAARIEGAVYVEGVLVSGLADLGDAVTSRLSNASPLSHQLVAEAMPGSVDRIMRRAT